MIYVDDPIQFTDNPKFKNWCHMWSSSSLNELENFALRIGLKREWLQKSQSAVVGEFWHFDISPEKRELALSMGAQYMKLRDWILLKTEESRKTIWVASHYTLHTGFKVIGIFSTVDFAKDAVQRIFEGEDLRWVSDMKTGDWNSNTRPVYIERYILDKPKEE